MPALLDIALALTVLVGTFFLGTVALALFKELTKKDSSNDDQNPPASK